MADNLSHAERIIAEAAALPLRDAAYTLHRWGDMLDRFELDADAPYTDAAALEAARARSIAMARARLDRANAHKGPTFARLKRAHPAAADEALQAAIKAAVKFDDDCFAHYPHQRGDEWDKAVRAVAGAARDSPGYLEVTLQVARNYVAYCMK